MKNTFFFLLLLFLFSFPAFAQETAVATKTTVMETYEAVGTVRPRTETRVEAQVTARIVKIAVRSGQRVKRGDTLVVLDSRELTSQRDQAREAFSSARAAVKQAQENITASKAAFDKASAQYKRIKALHETKAVATSELDAVEADYVQAEAALRRAREGVSGAVAAKARAEKQVEQADIALDYGVIRALDDGEVVRRESEPGDLAFPGKAILVLQTGGSLRLEAQVREGLIGSIRPGTELQVRISAQDRLLRGIVEEVEPSADPRTRSFVVKVGLPVTAGLYPGMFGQVRVPVGERETVLVPTSAVRKVGQLETVTIQQDDFETTVYVKTGATHNGNIEIISGLGGGETVVLEAGNDR